ncbi:MAG: hypothetical protein ACRBFS_21575 [Aureispira sp.]
MEENRSLTLGYGPLTFPLLVYGVYAKKESDYYLLTMLVMGPIDGALIVALEDGKNPLLHQTILLLKIAALFMAVLLFINYLKKKPS